MAQAAAAPAGGGGSGGGGHLEEGEGKVALNAGAGVLRAGSGAVDAVGSNHASVQVDEQAHGAEERQQAAGGGPGAAGAGGLVTPAAIRLRYRRWHAACGCRGLS